MPRIALLIEYLGSNFYGSQYQSKGRTVQSELEGALSVLLRQNVRIVLSGRTDSGVHARGQVAHFDVHDLEYDLWRLVWGLNGILADDISVEKAQVVPHEFHARHSAIEREYVYCVLNRPQRSALLKDTHYFMPHSLDLKAMSKAATYLLGNRDFSAFRSSNSDRGTSLCTVTRAELLRIGEGRLEFWIAANHFVYNMVRIIVGTLIDIGRAEKTPDDLKKALQKCDRGLAGPTAPAWGLSLASVKYPESFQLFKEAALQGISYSGQKRQIRKSQVSKDRRARGAHI
jgi:tRNA pseudouridine38-40 synthase